MEKKEKYYSLKRILQEDCRYNVIFGERSNGKTYAVLHHALERYFKTGEQLAIIRRWEEDFVGANSMRSCYASLSCNGSGENEISKLSKGKYTGVEYYGGKYYLTQYDQEKDKNTRTSNIVAHAFALTQGEHYKSGAYPRITTVLFDEFMTRKMYLPNEFVEFQNILSTIIRDRDNVTIFMCANTVNKYGCPYFDEMGLYRVKNMSMGTIDVYTYGQSDLRVAVEWVMPGKHKKASDVYFAFDNPRLKMITTGCWEMDIYPHLPHKYLPKDIQFVYFIVYDKQMLQCEIVCLENMTFTYIHRKTTPIRGEDKDLIYTTAYSPNPNQKRKITNTNDKITQKVYWYFLHEKVFYQDNDVGEVVRNYLQWCRISPKRPSCARFIAQSGIVPLFASFTRRGPKIGPFCVLGDSRTIRRVPMHLGRW